MNVAGEQFLKYPYLKGNQGDQECVCVLLHLLLQHPKMLSLVTLMTVLGSGDFMQECNTTVELGKLVTQPPATPARLGGQMVCWYKVRAPQSIQEPSIQLR